MRTIYRDIADLSLSGVPVEGEAGVGYVLRHKLDLPPLMFDRNELAAVELGLRFVVASAGQPLSEAAIAAFSKVRSVLPKAAGGPPSVALYVTRRDGTTLPPVGQVFVAIERRCKLQIDYTDGNGQATRRTIWPLGVFFWGDAWTVLGWCELRDDFRTFRLERISQFEVLSECFPDAPGRRLGDYFRWMEKVHAVPLTEFDPF